MIGAVSGPYDIQTQYGQNQNDVEANEWINWPRTMPQLKSFYTEKEITYLGANTLVDDIIDIWVKFLQPGTRDGLLDEDWDLEEVENYLSDTQVDNFKQYLFANLSNRFNNMESFGLYPTCSAIIFAFEAAGIPRDMFNKYVNLFPAQFDVVLTRCDNGVKLEVDTSELYRKY